RPSPRHDRPQNEFPEHSVMTITVTVAEAKPHLSELLARVENTIADILATRTRRQKTGWGWSLHEKTNRAVCGVIPRRGRPVSPKIVVAQDVAGSTDPRSSSSALSTTFAAWRDFASLPDESRTS